MAWSKLQIDLDSSGLKSASRLVKWNVVPRMKNQHVLYLGRGVTCKLEAGGNSTPSHCLELDTVDSPDPWALEVLRSWPYLHPGVYLAMDALRSLD